MRPESGTSLFYVRFWLWHLANWDFPYGKSERSLYTVHIHTIYRHTHTYARTCTCILRCLRPLTNSQREYRWVRYVNAHRYCFHKSWIARVFPPTPYSLARLVISPLLFLFSPVLPEIFHVRRYHCADCLYRKEDVFQQSRLIRRIYHIYLSLLFKHLEPEALTGYSRSAGCYTSINNTTVSNVIPRLFHRYIDLWSRNIV